MCGFFRFSFIPQGALSGCNAFNSTCAIYSGGNLVSEGAGEGAEDTGSTKPLSTKHEQPAVDWRRSEK